MKECLSLSLYRINNYIVLFLKDVDNFEPSEPLKNAAGVLVDKWEGEDEDEDVKVT